MERSATPNRPPAIPEQNAPARKKVKTTVPNGADQLIRPLLFEAQFSGLKEYPGVGDKRKRNM
jgi:hypothetical protein